MGSLRFAGFTCAGKKEKQIAENSVVFEYELGNKNLGFALAKINGRYPNFGKTINKICQEIYYVVSGNGKLFIEDKEVELKGGDVFLIESGKKYYVIGKNLILSLLTSPAWYSDQQEIINK